MGQILQEDKSCLFPSTASFTFRSGKVDDLLTHLPGNLDYFSLLHPGCVVFSASVLCSRYLFFILSSSVLCIDVSVSISVG